MHIQNNLIDGTNDWNQFSCIHSTGEEPFNFVVYNSSHLLNNNEELNTKSKVTIKFPRYGSYFIIFHGRLIHNGDKSLQDTKTNESMFSARMFSYLRVPEHNANFNGNFRQSGRLKNYSVTLDYGKVDRDSFVLKKESINKTQGQIIELPSNYNFLQNPKSNLQPVIGNMNLDGWEVYKGINFKGNNLKNHASDLQNLIVKLPKRWSGISSTNRKMIVLSSLDVISSNIPTDYQSLYRAFNILLNDYLRKIPYLEEVEMDNQAILANMGYVNEQQPHRDY